MGSPLTGGMNNTVLPVEVDGIRYCVKVYAETRREFASREIAVLRLLDDCPVCCPRLLAATDDERAILISWVEGSAVLAERWDAGRAASLGEELSALHRTEMPPGLQDVRWPRRRMIDRIARLIDDATLRSGWERTCERLGLMTDAFLGREVLGRGDPAMSNVLVNRESLAFIDFENAGRSEAAWELADLLEHPQNAGLSRDVREVLVERLGIPGESELLRAYRYVMRVFWAVRLQARELPEVIGRTP